MKKLVLFVLVYGVTGVALAQVVNARLSGTVSDPSGAVIPRAELRLVNIATGVALKQATDARGGYAFVNLPPGRYRLTVTAPGFKKLTESLSPLRVGSMVRLDLKLQVGAATQVVTVRGAPPMLQTESATIGYVVQNRQILTLPLLDRNFTQLALLGPGAELGATGGQNGSTGGLTLAGSRSQMNNFTLDGVSDIDPNFAQVSLQPSINSIQEFRIDTNGYSAAHGRYSGGQINVITKSGTNQLHGSLYDFLQNTSLNARNFFAGPGPQPAFRRNDFGGTIGGPIEIPGIYKGKNRTFFFFDYEGVRQQSASSNVSHVPSALERQGNFSQTFLPNGQLNVIYDPASAPVDANGYYLSPRLPFPGNIIPANRIPPQMEAMAQLLPAPNLPGTGLNYVDNQPGTFNSNQWSARIDENVNDRLRLFGRYTYQNQPQVAPQYMPGRYTTNNDAPQNLALSLNWTLNPTVVNETRLGFLRNVVTSLGGSSQGASLVKQFWPPKVLSIGLPDLSSDPGLPSFIILGNGGLWFNNGAPGDPRGTSSFKNNVFEGNDSLTVIHGHHLFQFGGVVRHTQFRTVNFFTIRGSAGFQGLYTTSAGPTGITNYGGGNGFADFLLGLPTDDTRNFSDSPLYTRWNEYALYGEDTWRMTKRLTADLGLRWEYPAPISVVPVRTGYNFTSNAAGHLIYETVPNLANIVPEPLLHTFTYLGGTPFQRTIYMPDHRNFAPRIGLAYQLNPKTVVRSAFGVFFTEGPADMIATEAANAPFAIDEDVVTAYWSSPLAPSVCISVCGEKQSSIPANPWANGFGFAPSASIINPFVPTYGMNPDFTLGYTMQYNFSVQRLLAPGFMLQTAYVGSQSRNLPQQTVENIGVGSPGQVPYLPKPIPGAGSMWIYNWNGIANYNALQVQLEHRTRAGLYFVASYTWSKNIDTASAVSDVVQGLISEGQINPVATRALSDLNVGQMFHFAGDYAPALDQHLLRNASPLVKHVVANWTLGSILTLQGGNPQYPGFAGVSVPGIACNLPSSERTPLHFFNTNCVVAPKPGQLSDVPRDWVIGPGLYDWDASVIKEVHFTEDKELQFRLDAFNVLNHPNFIGLNTILGTGAYGSVAAARPGRNLQVSLNLSF